MNFPAGWKNWNKFEKNCPDVVFNILCVDYNDAENVENLSIKQGFISKPDLERQK